MAAKQIDLYAPDVIIVCGTATLQCMNQDLQLDLSKPRHTVTRRGAVVDIHHWRGRRIVWAPHPAAHIKPEEWVDAVIEAAHKASNSSTKIPNGIFVLLSSLNIC